MIWNKKKREGKVKEIKKEKKSDKGSTCVWEKGRSHQAPRQEPETLRSLEQKKKKTIWPSVH